MPILSWFDGGRVNKSVDTIETPSGEVAQLVEHTTENRGVASSILALAISPR